MIILHGDNQVTSRQALLAAKEGRTVLEFTGSNLLLDQLVNAVETNSLFGQANTIVIERAFAKKEIVEYLINNQDKDIIVWEPKDLSAKVKNFKNVQKFDLPKYIFSFLDNPTVPGLHLVLQTMPAEQIMLSAELLTARRGAQFLCRTAEFLLIE